MLVVAVAILGLAFGSFVNAWTWRIKVKKPVVKDRSQCPHCHHKLNLLDLIPVASWLWLHGRCRYCQQPIAPWYPLVELLTASLFVLSFLVWDFNGYVSVIHFGIWLIELTLLVALAIYDLRWMILPDRIVKPLVVIAGLQVIIVAILQADGWHILNHVLAAVLGSGIFYLIHVLSKGRWMGGGDVKLAFVMGLILGLGPLLVAMLMAFNLAAIISIGLLASRRLTRKDLIAFGPFLIVGTITAVLFGRPIIEAYLRFSGLN